MPTVLIAYDLNSPGQDYDGLHDAIKGLASAWWHHLDSTWLVKTTKTPAEIRDLLGQKIDKGDELLVIDVTGRSRAWRGFNERGSTWLKQSY
jgi:hypothetical protein